MKLGFEQLECRRLMFSDWQNATNPLDTDGSGLVEPIDLLLVINDLRARDARTLGVKPVGYSGALCDVNGDGEMQAIDILLIINAFARYSGTQSLDVQVNHQADLNQNGVVLGTSVQLGGSTMKDSTIEVWEGEGETRTQIASTIANLEGVFTLSVSLPSPVSTLRVTTKDRLGRALETERIFRRGDVVADWNATLLRLVRESTSTAPNAPNILIKPPPPSVARNLAIVHIAMFDAVNAIDQIYDSYAYTTAKQTGASPAAAVSAAAYRAATRLFSTTFKGELDQTLAETLATIPEGDAKDRGIALGNAAADATLALRANDGANRTVAYQPGSDPGDWNRTLPTLSGPALPQWPEVTPFAMQTGNQFRPTAPPSLDSPAYAAAVDEVMRLGSDRSSERTADQTAIAKFWADGGGSSTPPGHWNQIAIDQGLLRNQSLVENARMMAMLNIALADAGIASWDAKFFYDLWRPIDAIQKASSDGNSATIENKGWTPLLQTPAFQSYTSGHSTFSHAAAKVLASLFGDQVNFLDRIDPGSTGIWPPVDETSLLARRRFQSFTQAAEEAGQSRIYGGIHFQFDNTAGESAGKSIGTLVSTTQLKLKSTN